MPRTNLRPVLYPTAIVVGILLIALVQTGVSPYAATRSLLLGGALCLVLSWLLAVVLGSRHQAAVVTMLAVLLVASPQPVLAAAVLLLLLTVLWFSIMNRGRLADGWRPITRAMSAVAAVVLVAAGISAVQTDRLAQIAGDLVLEGPAGIAGTVAAPDSESLPSVYLLLLDGYPRADKLKTEFQIDGTPFLDALRLRDFEIATRSRSNYGMTHMTLASMLGSGVPSDPAVGTAEYRHRISSGGPLQQFRDLGYEIISFSAGFEEVTLRRAERFVDSGQLNEFEWEMLERTSLPIILGLVAPTFLADQHRARTESTLEGLETLAAIQPAQPRFVLAHVSSPHSPQLSGAAGEHVNVRGFPIPFDDSDEYMLLGHDEYRRRLAGQIEYLNRRVLQVVDVLIRTDPGAVVVVFSDHGSGVRETVDVGGLSDTDLRTANLLAVRSPGRAGLIDDRSTLVNVLPRVLRAYAGTGRADVPETIYGVCVHGRLVQVERPD